MMSINTNYIDSFGQLETDKLVIILKYGMVGI